MGASFYENFSKAREVFEEANEILHTDLSGIIFNGPEDMLTETKTAQPAIFVTSMAILRVLKEEFSLPPPVCTAGLSLGEYSATTCANALGLESALKLVQLRSSLMHTACETTPGGMLVILGLEDEEVKNMVSKLNLPSDLWCANFNCPGQVVVSGTEKGLQLAQKAAKELGAKRALPLQVHGAFHSGLMNLAQEGVEKALATTSIRSPDFPVVMNATGQIATSAEEIKQNLGKQVTSSVLWHQCVHRCMQENPSHCIEIGCGSTLAGLNKRIGVEVPTLTIETVEDLEVLETLLSTTH
jgi:[acyl-carrier-protein] S-malonyltransferase